MRGRCDLALPVAPCLSLATLQCCRGMTGALWLHALGLKASGPCRCQWLRALRCVFVRSFRLPWPRLISVSFDMYSADDNLERAHLSLRSLSAAASAQMTSPPH